MPYLDNLIQKKEGGGYWDARLNAKEYDKKLRQQRKAFATIDSAMEVLNLLPSTVDKGLSILDTDSLSLTVPMTPMGFLFGLLKTLGVSEAELRKWITEILVYALPVVEIGLKAALLANIKTFVSCNADPRIPARYRKRVNDNIYKPRYDRGFVIPIGAIDPDGMLNLSPYTKPGLTRYFGISEERENPQTGEIEQVVSNNRPLVRADDFNAFLWYVMHKGKKQNPIKINPTSGHFTLNGKNYTLYSTLEASTIKYDLRGVTIVKCDDGPSGIPLGTTFYDERASQKHPNICMAYESGIDISGVSNIVTLVEVSSDWSSCNWYADKSNYFTSNTGLKKNRYRDLGKEKPICNVRYVKENELSIPSYSGGSPDNFLVTVLPKPAYVLPFFETENTHDEDGRKITKLSVHGSIVRLLFNEDGEPDSNGRYSLNSQGWSHASATTKSSAETVTYSIDDVDVVVNSKTGKYRLKNQSDASKLVECYQGLTVYEFNYDYIMSMKLLDPKVICQRLFDSTLNSTYYPTFSLTLNRLEDKSKYPFEGGKQRLLEVVRQILEEDEEINDCFYAFSNEQYEHMMQESDKIRYNRMPYDNGYDENVAIDMSDVEEILNNYPENGTLEEQKYVIEHALEVASGKFSDLSYGTSGTEGIVASADSGTIKVDFFTDILQKLTMEVVDALLTPKVLMLLMINKEMMGEFNEEDLKAITFENLMQAMKNIIRSLIREVRDLIMEKILDFILSLLAPVAIKLAAIIESERFNAYMAIIDLLLRWYSKGVQVVNGVSSVIKSLESIFKKRFKDGDSAFSSEIDLPSVLDDITYADIYESDMPDRTPIIEKC